MKRKVFDRRIVAGLVILLSVEITLLGVHLSWGGFRPHKAIMSTQLAGQVQKNENDLRRRGASSLVWEKSSADEPLYYYDSLLTLAQSTASLKLFKDTEVHLSENTLVTIEPQDDKAYGEIRLKFAKGSFQARNPFAKTQVASDTWSMEIKTGSEVDFRQVGENNYELSVNKGEVDFSSAHGKDKIGSKQMLRIEDSVVVPLERQEDLRWVDAPARRIYTHADTATVLLKWQGPGSLSLVRQTLGQQEESFALQVGEQQREIKLPLGHHRLFLRAGTRTSTALDIEIWKAPLLHLVSPLPRNRVKTAMETLFLWTRIAGVAKYELQLNGRTLHLNETLEQNSFKINFKEEDDAEWAVQGKDSEGFVIPPLYSYPLYIREAPLEAPKLRSPVLRKPAQDRGASFWWNLLLPKVQAEEASYQALFSWEPVANADHYVIEISERADFRKPLVTKVVTKNEFLWQRVQLHTYFWRVAAGTQKGRLGIFSEPAEVDLANAESSGVAVTRVTPPPAAPKVDTATPPPPVAAVAEPPSPVLPPSVRELKSRNFVEWRPVYRALKSTAAQNVRVDVQGASAKSVAIEVDRLYAPDRQVHIEANYTQFHFRPQPSEKYPFQTDLKWADISAQGVLRTSTSPWGYGLMVLHSAQFQRHAYEAIQTKDTFDLGIVVQGVWQGPRVQYTSECKGLAGSEYGVLLEQRLRVRMWGEFYGGAGAQGAFLLHGGGQTQFLQGELALGLEF